MTTTFNNFESYAEAIQDVDLDVRLLQPNERCWSIQQRELGTLRVQHGIEGSGLLTRGAVKPDGWALYVQRSGDPVPVNGKLLMDHSIAVLPPRSEFCFSGQGRIEWYSVFVPSVLIFPTNDTPAKSVSVEVITVRDQLFGQLRSTLDAAFDLTANRSSAASSEFLEAAISEKLISAFRQMLDENVDSKRPTEQKVHVNRKSLIAQVLELINDSNAWEMSVPELASATGVSQRTLLSTFREQIGVTPQTYLITHRLHLARRSLMKTAPQSTTVASVAATFGFFDYGRFAGRYLTMFGEHPSETIRQRTLCSLFSGR